jgi:apolipoprotein N-acyltransferase
VRFAGQLDEAKKPMPLWAALVVAAASGPIMDIGFPDVYVWPATFVGIGLLLYAVRGRRAGAAFLVAFVGGLTYYFIQISWAALFLGPVPLSALSVLESLFYGLGGMSIAVAYRVIPRIWNSPLARLGLLPAVVAGLWILREGVSSTWPYGGFSWARVAMSQSLSPFSSEFSWIGISGVSFVMVFLVALAMEAHRMPPLAIRLRYGLVALVVLLVLLVPAFPIALKGSTTVAAVQGAGPAGYFDPHNYGDLLAAQYKATVPLFDHKGIDMVIWPEGASDIDPVKADGALEQDVAAAEFNEVSERIHAPLLAGTIQHRGTEYFNTSLLWEAGKGELDHYDKKHPVPFGEYVPDRSFWRQFAPSLIDLIGRDYTPGTTNTVFNVNGVVAGIDICFDITDDQVMRDSIDSGAQILIAQTNNADFGHTDESVQQLEIARIRAMELGRSLVNDSTVGTTAAILPDGRTVAQLKTYVPGTLVVKLPLSTTITPATWLGVPLAWFLSLSALGILLIAGVSSRTKKKRQGK